MQQQHRIISISNPKIIETEGGYYIGRTCESQVVPGVVIVEPYDQLSEYYGTRIAAERDLPVFVEQAQEEDDILWHDYYEEILLHEEMARVQAVLDRI